jgi:hypothetical protein
VLGGGKKFGGKKKKVNHRLAGDWSGLAYSMDPLLSSESSTESSGIRTSLVGITLTACASTSAFQTGSQNMTRDAEVRLLREFSDRS